MKKILASALCLSFLILISASAKWFWQSGIECESLDKACLVEYAVTDIEGMVDETSVNTFGKALGSLWLHLDADTRQKLLDAYLEQPDSESVGYYVNIAIAKTPITSGAVQALSDVLDDPAQAGNLPLEYWGQSLSNAALKADPTATADLAITKGKAFSRIAIDGLYRTIAWMARNDLTRLEAYLAAHDPSSASYFSPSVHLFQVAAELCDKGQDGKQLADIALRDLLRTRITATERFGIPMRAVLACEGLPAASANVNDMFISVAEDLDRQKARGRDGAYAIRRIINIVNNHALTPVIRKYHEEGQQASAEALAGRLLPEPQVIVTIDENQSLSIEKSKVQEKLSEILNEKTDEATSLDPVTQLEWFTKSFVANTTINSADYAVFAINPILTLWPQPLAQEALSIATPLLASSKYKKADALRLKTGLAIAQAKVCRSSETALQSLLDEIATQERAAVRVNAVADYLIYLESHDDALPICTN